MAEPTIVTGPYKASFGGENFLFVTADGFKITKTIKTKPIITDARGDEEIDDIYTGALWLVEFESIEVTSGKMDVFLTGDITGSPLLIGELIKADGAAGELVLEPQTTGGGRFKFVCHKAFPLGDKDFIARSTIGQQLPMSFKLYPDLTKAEPNQFVTKTETT